MRVLRVFHSAVVDAWRERERHLRSGGVEVDLLTAKRWNEGGSDVRLKPRPGEPVTGLRTWGRHPALFVYSPLPLWRALGRPYDVIDVQEEPFALATAEILLLRRLRRQRAPYVLYSAQNIDKRYPVPFRWLERWALRNAAGLSVCNEEAGRICERKGLPGRATLIPLGVDTDFFSPGGSARARPGARRRVRRPLGPSQGRHGAPGRRGAARRRAAPDRRRRPGRDGPARCDRGRRHRGPRRARRIVDPGAAPGLLPRPRRPGRPVAADPELARAVRPGGRGGDGVRRAGRGQRHRGPARRRRRRRRPGAPGRRRPAGQGADERGRRQS